MRSFIKKFLTRAVLPLALAGSLFGGAAAMADDATSFTCVRTDGSIIYPAFESTWDGCYPQQNYKPAAATMKGTHSYSNAAFRAVFGLSNGGISVSVTHYLNGTNWAPGFSIPTNTVWFRYDVINYGGYNDVIIGHK